MNLKHDIEKPKNLKVFQSEEWNERTDKIYAILQPPITKDALKDLISNGRLLMYHVTVNAVFIGTFFARIDKQVDGKHHFCVNWTVADDPKNKFFEFLTIIYDMIVPKGFYIRIHSERKGIDKFCEDNGFKFYESIYLKEVT